MDFGRGDWWLVRMDFWEPKRWDISCDPDRGWDWRWKVGSSKSRAVRRLQAAREQRFNEFVRRDRLLKLRHIADSLRK